MTAQRDPKRKDLSLWVKEPCQERFLGTPVEGENPYLLAFCGLLVPNLSRRWGALFH